MRILTWNVNVLRTCLDYHPFSSMEKKNVEGLLDQLDAQVFCFQEHKTVRAKLERSMACPGPYDAFWTFPRSKTGYSGVCTYVDSRYCVPFKAEEGITGLLLGDVLSTMKPPWTEEERIGHYPDAGDIRWLDDFDGTAFQPKKLDMEGRAVVCDFGLFVLFNLYCPNETNETRRPYKMNFLHALQDRVRLLQNAGREVIIVGDINIVRAPIDSGEGGVRSSFETHYEHPARRILDDWCAPKGPMIDVVRESWPDRDDMFTCWNQKLDARSSNYGSRIDMILCTPGLRPWIKGGDILPKVYGSDHCPVYMDLHESITTPDGKELRLSDILNPENRLLSTAPVYPSIQKREAPEPPRFATRFLDEFSGKQTSLKSFFGGGGKPKEKRPSATPTPTPSPAPGAASTKRGMTADAPKVPEEGLGSSRLPPPAPDESIAAPFSMARSAFAALDKEANANGDVRPNGSVRIDMSLDSDDERPTRSSTTKPKMKPTKSTENSKSYAGQASLASFFTQPSNKPAKRKSSPPRTVSRSKRPSMTQTPPTPSSTTTSSTPVPPVPGQVKAEISQGLTEEEDLLISQALANADAEREVKKANAAPQWTNLFAKKLPPLCTAHQKPCKDFYVMKPGPNKGKRFWLCSLPVGAGYDMGRAKRLREEVNPKFRCDFFMWDSANTRKETPPGAV